MQLSPTADQWKVIEKVAQYLLFPALGYFFRTLVIRLRAALNDIITENVNRIKNEIVADINIQFINQESLTNSYIDTKFKEHEDNAFTRITALERSVAGLVTILQEIKEQQSKNTRKEQIK